VREDLRELLHRVARGELAADAALHELLPRHAAVADFAIVDHDRATRCGFPEVVLCAGKTPEQAAAIAAEILAAAPRVLLTRAAPEHAAAVRARFPHAVHHARARCITVDPEPLPRRGLVAIVAAGTADLPVADEARVTLEILGASVETFYDVGVAGLHRLLARLPRIRRACAVIAVAGMDGAMPAVLAGQIDRPVIAVPTSIGYGASFAGVTPLLNMMASCAAGVGVVNIDNGFGAGYLAALINRLATEGPPADRAPSEPTP
jgi:NCAIR mutase (PurE)-related protein